MTLFNRLTDRFRKDETGALMAEAVLVLPFMLWAYLALFVYWDSYRAINTVQKSAYTISDMISREMVSVSDGYINGMDRLLEYMIDQDQDAKLRVSSISWSAIQNNYQVHWSRSPNNAMPILTNGSIATVRNGLPNMADGDYIMLVEVEVNYEPAFDVGLNDQTLKQFIVTRPRFVRCVPINNGTCPVV